MFLFLIHAFCFLFKIMIINICNSQLLYNNSHSHYQRIFFIKITNILLVEWSRINIRDTLFQNIFLYKKKKSISLFWEFHSRRQPLQRCIIKEMRFCALRGAAFSRNEGSVLLHSALLRARIHQRKVSSTSISAQKSSGCIITRFSLETWLSLGRSRARRSLQLTLPATAQKKPAWRWKWIKEFAVY